MPHILTRAGRHLAALERYRRSRDRAVFVSRIDAPRLQQHVSLAHLMMMRQLELRRYAIEKWGGFLLAMAGAAPFL